VQGIRDAHADARAELSKPIPAAMLSVGAGIDELRGAVNRLEERLMPIRTPVDVVASGSVAPSVPTSPITEQLNAYAEQIQALTGRLENILGDIEL
jgi:hypothetical protein